MLRMISAWRGTAGSGGYGGRSVGLGLLVVVVMTAGGADGAGGFELDVLMSRAQGAARWCLAWYEATPAADRMTWGGLAACAGLGLGVLVERMARVRRRRVMPKDFATRFLGRLQDGKLDRGKALDFCELNPSPASRVALAAVRRWGRPVGDLERAVGLAHRVEAEVLRRNVGTLRRLAALTPLVGLLGTLLGCGRAFSGHAAGAAWGPNLAAALGPLTAGVAIAILALVAYDGMSGRVESLTGDLDRVGAETIDAIAMALPVDPRPGTGPIAGPATGTTQGRTPHQMRIEVPKPAARAMVEDEDDFE